VVTESTMSIPNEFTKNAAFCSTKDRLINEGRIPFIKITFDFWKDE
jgi:hypothetical protein